MRTLFYLLWAAALIAFFDAQTSKATDQGKVLTLVNNLSSTNLDDGAPSHFTDFQIVTNKAFLARQARFNPDHPGGLDIWDLSNVISPIPVGRSDGRPDPNAITISGNFAYVTGGTVFNQTNDSGWMEIYDVTTLSSPRRMSGIETAGRGLAVQVAGNIAYVAQSVRWTGTNLAGAIQIFDVSRPSNPILLATYDTAGSASAIAVRGGFAYLADGAVDLEVLEVRDPAAPKRVGGYDTDEWRNYGGFEHGGATVHVRLVGGSAFAAGEDGLHILSVYDPTKPIRIGGYNSLPMAYAFEVSGKYVCMSYWLSSQNQFALALIDMGSPANPTVLARAKTLGWPKTIQFIGRFLYVSAGSILIYEINDLPALRPLARDEGKVAFSWEAIAGFGLQTKSSLNESEWEDVPNSVNSAGIELPADESRRFFRLYRPW